MQDNLPLEPVSVDMGMANLLANPPMIDVPERDLQRAAILGKDLQSNEVMSGTFGVNLADSMRLKQAEGVLASGQANAESLRTIQDLGKAMNTLDETAADFAVYDSMAAKDDEPPLIPSVAELSARRKANLEYAVKAAGVAKGFIEGKKSNQGFKGAAKVTAEFFESLLVPDFYLTVGNVLQSVDPNFGIVDRANISGALKRLREVVATLPQEESNQVVKRVINEVEKRKGIILDNDYQAVEMLDTIFGNFKDGDIGVSDTVFAALEAVSAVPIAGQIAGVARKGARVLMNIATPAGTAAHSTSGLKALGQLYNTPNASGLAQAGVSPAQVLGHAGLPKTSASFADDIPFIEDIFIPESQRVAVKTDVADKIKATIGTRLKDSVVEIQDVAGGFDYTLSIGKANGRGFASEAAARTYMTKSVSTMTGVPPHDVVKVGNEWFVNMKGRYNWDLNDVGAVSKADVEGSGMLKMMLGKAVAFGKQVTESGTVAVLNGAKVEAALKSTLKPFDSLASGEKSRVMSLLDQYEGTKRLTRADMAAEGLTEKGMAAMEAVYKVADTNLMIRNQTVRGRLVSEGFREATLNGQVAVVRKVDSFNGEVVDAAGKTIKNVDTKKYDIFESLEPMGKNNARFVAVEKATPLTLRGLPQKVIKSVEGYMPRLYQSPFYVREILPNGFSRAVHTAGSIGDAENMVTLLGQADPKKKYAVVRATETSEQARNFDELEQLREQGMLYSSQRRPDVLKDAAGNPKLVDVQQRINSMVQSAANSAGVTRWAMVMGKQWEAAYGAKFGKFNALERPMRATGASEKEFQEALALHDHIRLVTGTLPQQMNPTINHIRNTIADALYNRGFRFLGNEVSGLTTKTIGAMKDFTFAAYLGLNPLRQLLVQTTMIPTYMGVNGGLKYAASGKFFRDSGILTTALRMGDEAGIKLAQATGYSRAEAMELITSYKNSGLSQLADNHIFTIGTMSDISTKSGGAIRETLGKTVNAVKSIGFDMAVGADKAAAFLFARNKFLTETGKLPTSREDMQKVASFAETLALNQNRSDTLAAQQGVLSLFTQFLSHQIKMSGRLMGLEKGLTGAEKTRMAMIGLATYGTAGYGMNELVDYVINRSGAEVTDEAKDVLRDGLHGYLLDSIFRGFDDMDGEFTDLASSGNIGPASGGLLGLTPDTFLKVWQGSLDISSSAEIDLKSLAASFSLLSNIGQTIKFAAMLGGETDIDTDDKALALGTEVLTKFPITNNFMKGLMAYRIGYAVDSKGNPVVEKSKGEAIAQLLLGVKSAKEEDVSRAMADLNGEVGGTDKTGLDRKIREAAVEDARSFYIPLINRIADGQERVDVASRILSERNAFFRRGLDSTEIMMYNDVVMRELNKTGVLKSQKVLDTIAKGAGNTLRLNEDLIARMRGYSFKGAQELADEVENMVQFKREMDK